MVEIISSEKYNRESNMLEFARCLGALATPICESTGISVVDSQLDKEAQDRLYLHLTNLEAGSPEFLVKKAVEAIILNKSGPAGNTTNHFINNFRKEVAAGAGAAGVGAGADLTEVRHFIDGMHEYILETHIAELVGVLQGTNGQGQGGRTISSGSNGNRHSSSALLAGAGGELSGMTDDITSQTVRSTVGSPEQRDSESQQLHLQQDDVVVVSYVVFGVVEEVVFFPLQDVMSSLFYADEAVLVSCCCWRLWVMAYDGFVACFSCSKIYSKNNYLSIIFL